MFNDLRSEAVVHSVDIGVIFYHLCLIFLFLITIICIIVVCQFLLPGFE